MADGRKGAGVVGIGLAGLLAWTAIAAAAGESGPVEVLNGRSPWRFHAAWRTPATVEDGVRDLGGGHPIERTRWIRDSYTEPTPPAPDGWTDPDFDDSGWRRRVGPPFDGYGYGAAAEIGHVAARTRFGVTDVKAVGPLTLRLVYRGGVAVYLNGTEIARGHMPAGPVDPLTPAEDYAPEVFVGADGKPLRDPGRRGPRERDVEHYRKRFRTLEVELPRRLLREGTNVLAVDLHRAAIPMDLGPVVVEGWDPKVGKNVWGTVGLVGVRLTAPAANGVAPNTGRAPPLQVWTLDTLERAGKDVSWSDPFEPLRPVRLAAPQGGVTSGQVVVSAAEPISKVAATLGDLKSDAGATFAAPHVEVRYATPADSVPRLLDEPTLPAEIVPVYLTARIPPETAAGTYRGTLRIAGLKEPVTVPVELRVYGWRLPPLKEYGTSVSLLHAPESVHRHYDVPLWSDRHFDLLARSMALMGYAGNWLLSVPVLAEDVFGDHPLVVFKEEGGRLVPDLQFARRYLELYDREAGPPKFLAIQVWNYAVSRRGVGRDGGKVKWMADTIKVGVLEGGRIVTRAVPVYTRPGTEPTWEAVARGIEGIVRDLGWSETRMLWGTGGDNLPTGEIVDFFKRIAPDRHWRVVTHGGSVREWGATVEDRTQPHGGLVVGYANVVRRNVSWRPVVEDAPIQVLKRDGVSSCPIDYLSMAPLGRIAAKFKGPGFLSFDTWGWETEGGKRRGPIRSYVPFGNIHPSGGPFVVPGPDGAAPSPQVEVFREGLQITEAILRIRRAKLAADRAAAFEATVRDLMDVMESNRRVRPAGVADVWPLVRRIYAMAEEVRP